MTSLLGAGIRDCCHGTSWLAGTIPTDGPVSACCAAVCRNRFDCATKAEVPAAEAEDEPDAVTAGVAGELAAVLLELLEEQAAADSKPAVTSATATGRAPRPALPALTIRGESE